MTSYKKQRQPHTKKQRQPHTKKVTSYKSSVQLHEMEKCNAEYEEECGGVGIELMWNQIVKEDSIYPMGV